MALQIATVYDSIAALSVAGVRIYDIDEIPVAMQNRYPAIIPLPRLFDNFTMERNSFGGGSTALMTVTYNLHYRLLFAPVGEGRTNTLAIFSDMVDKAALFLDAVLAIDTFEGGVDIVPLPITGDGIVNDPAEIPFWGCDFVLMVTEFVN